MWDRTQTNFERFKKRNPLRLFLSKVEERRKKKD